mgnify:CR=1 FL=1
MTDTAFDTPPDGGAELAALLARSGVDYRREGDRFSFLFAGGGCRWRTVCDCREGLVLVYGIHPAPVRDGPGALALCSSLNARVVRGGFFVQDGHIVFRTSARLGEQLDAQERTAQALEYNAAAMTRFWERLAAAARGAGPDIPSEIRGRAAFLDK